MFKHPTLILETLLPVEDEEYEDVEKGTEAGGCGGGATPPWEGGPLAAGPLVDLEQGLKKDQRKQVSPEIEGRYCRSPVWEGARVG